MNLIDTVGVNHIFTDAIKLADNYYLAPDISDEVEMTEIIHNKHVPEEIKSVAELDEFNESVYIHQYRLALNSYRKRSFYNMKGFGDVSIIATIYTLLDGYKKQKTEQLFSTSEPIVIYTNDANLTNVIISEFAKNDVSVKPASAIT
jgi:hypothetical protein